eukprot:SAG11_NODE_458_length_9290_cov_2.641388_3_plen_370_part_00
MPSALRSARCRRTLTALAIGAREARSTLHTLRQVRTRLSPRHAHCARSARPWVSRRARLSTPSALRSAPCHRHTPRMCLPHQQNGPHNRRMRLQASLALFRPHTASILRPFRHDLPRTRRIPSDLSLAAAQHRIAHTARPRRRTLHAAPSTFDVVPSAQTAHVPSEPAHPSPHAPHAVRSELGSVPSRQRSHMPPDNKPRKCAALTVSHASQPVLSAFGCCASGHASHSMPKMLIIPSLMSSSARDVSASVGPSVGRGAHASGWIMWLRASRAREALCAVRAVQPVGAEAAHTRRRRSCTGSQHSPQATRNLGTSLPRTGCWAASPPHMSHMTSRQRCMCRHSSRSQSGPRMHSLPSSLCLPAGHASHA